MIRGIFGKRKSTRTASRHTRAGIARRLRFEQVESRVMLSAWEGEAPAEPASEAAWQREAPAEPLGQGAGIGGHGSGLEDHAPAIGLLGARVASPQGDRLVRLTGSFIPVRMPLDGGFIDISESFVGGVTQVPWDLDSVNSDFPTWHSRGEPGPIVVVTDSLHGAATNAAFDGFPYGQTENQRYTIVSMPERGDSLWKFGRYPAPTGDPSSPPRDAMMIALSPDIPEASSGAGGLVSIASIGGPETPTLTQPESARRPALVADKPSESNTVETDSQLEGAKGRSHVFEMGAVLDRGEDRLASSSREIASADGAARRVLLGVEPGASRSAASRYAGEGARTQGSASPPAAGRPVEGARSAAYDLAEPGLSAQAVGATGRCTTLARDVPATGAEASESARFALAPSGIAPREATAGDLALSCTPRGDPGGSLRPAAPGDRSNCPSWRTTAYSSLAVLGSFLAWRHLSAFRADRGRGNPGKSVDLVDSFDFSRDKPA
jgi:hypothetical protein